MASREHGPRMLFCVLQRRGQSSQQRVIQPTMFTELRLKTPALSRGVGFISMTLTLQKRGLEARRKYHFSRCGFDVSNHHATGFWGRRGYFVFKMNVDKPSPKPRIRKSCVFCGTTAGQEWAQAGQNRHCPEYIIRGLEVPPGLGLTPVMLLDHGGVQGARPAGWVVGAGFICQ